MNLDEYQRRAMRTLDPQEAPPLAPEIDKAALIHGALKLAGEAGEVADLVGKWHGQGHPLNVEAIAEELGDLLWHLAEVATAIGYPLGGIAIANLDKLSRRYPAGFEAKRSIDREE